MSQSEKVDCPVCGRSFDTFVITDHVNRCLARSESTESEGETIEIADSSPSSGAGKGMGKRSAGCAKTSFLGKEKASVTKQTKLQQSPPSFPSSFFTGPKRANSSLAGKSPSQPPMKKMKSTDQERSPDAQSVRSPAKNMVPQSTERKPLGLAQQSANGPHTHSVLAFGDGGDKTRSKSNGNLKNSSSGRLNDKEFVPLAERMRPCSLDDYVGQTKVLGNDSLLRSLLQADEIPSIILWGPPGCGKTTLAHIVASKAKTSSKSRFVQLSATTSGISDVKEVVKVAKNDQSMFKRKTILFVDEIHRFNKTQQDTFLPHVENGTITLIGATTENPSFQLNTALLSRCRVIVLEKLSSREIKLILSRALAGIGAVTEGGDEAFPKNVKPDQSKGSEQLVVVEEAAIQALADLCDGDARVALNGLQLAVQSQVAMAAQKKKTFKTTADKDSITYGESKLDGYQSALTTVRVNVDHIKKGLQRTHLLYDKKGDEHFNSISALHKSIRGSDANAALYWLARMLEGGEDSLYIARRLVRCASEDIGLADPLALNQTVAAYQACHFIGRPECNVILAQAAVYLARAPKSIEVYSAYCEAKKCVTEWKGPQPSVPLHIRNAPTSLMKNLGYGKDYKYNPAFNGPVDQTYLPPEIQNVNFFASKTMSME